MAAGDVATTFTVEGSKEVIKALDNQTKAVKKYASTINPMYAQIQRDSKKTADLIKEMKAFDFDDVFPERGLQNLVDYERQLEDLAKAAEELEEQLEDSKITGIAAFTKTGKKVNELIPKISSLSSRFQKMGKTAQIAIGVGVVTALAAAAAALAAFSMAARFAWKKMQEGREEAIKLEKAFAIMKNTFTELNRGENQISFSAATQQMEKLYKTTLFTREAIVSMQAAIARTTTTTDLFTRATKAALDVSAAKPTMSVEASSQWITTLLGDPSMTVDKFRRAEIQVSAIFQRMMERMVSEGDLVGAQGAILDQLVARFDGAAETAADTIGGRFQMIQKEWSNMWMEGSQVFLNELYPAIENMFKYMKENKDDMIQGFKGAAVIAGQIGEMVTRWAPSLKILAKFAGATDVGYKGRPSESAQDSMLSDYLAALRSPIRTLGEALWQNSEQWEKNLPTIQGTNSEEIQSLLEGRAYGTPAEMNQLELDRKANVKEYTGKSAAQLADDRNKEREENEKWLEASEKALARNLEGAAKEQDEYTRALKRYQVLVADQATPMERYAAQEAKIYEVRHQALKTGNMTLALDRELVETRMRLFKVARMARDEEKNAAAAAKIKAARKDAETFGKLLDKYDPTAAVKALVTDFKLLMASSNPRARMGMENILEKISGIAGRGDGSRDSSFQSISAGLDSLYQTIRSQVLAQDTPEVKQLKRMEKIERDAAQRNEFLMQEIINRSGPARAAPSAP